MIQLDFFQDDEMSLMQHKIDKLEDSNTRMRKALFAKHGELYKNYLDLMQRFEILERAICQGMTNL